MFILLKISKVSEGRSVEWVVVVVGHLVVVEKNYVSQIV